MRPKLLMGRRSFHQPAGRRGWVNLKGQSFQRNRQNHIEKFKEDQKDPAIPKLIEDDRNEGITNGVNATPSFFIDGEKFENPQDIKGFQKAIDAKLGSGTGNKIPETETPVAKQLQL